jgi:hypothetical protein
MYHTGLSNSTIHNTDLMQVACHCLECRKMTGSAFSVSIAVPRSSLSVTGDVKNYVFTQEVDGEFTTAFCPNCGTTIYMLPSREDLKEVALIGVGTLNPEDFAALSNPNAEIFTKHRASWLNAMAGADQINGTL